VRLSFVGLALAILIGSWSCGEEFGSEANGGGRPSSGSGAGEACSSLDDCHTPEAPCMRADCQEGRCVEVPRVAGPAPAGSQNLGDCKQISCNGEGQVLEAANDADLPVDGNPCTNDLCTNGTATNPPLPAQSPCGDGLECDGSGNCTGCTGPEQCGPAPLCAVWKCSNSVCEAENKRQGAPANHQMPGDCTILRCDGNGNAVPQIDDTDKPADPMPGDCVSLGCDNGTVASVELQNSAACNVPAQGICCNGVCIQVTVCTGQGGAGGSGGNPGR